MEEKETTDTEEHKEVAKPAILDPVESVTEEKTDIIAEARQVRDENKKILEQLKEERKKIERATAEIMMGGRSHAIPGKSPEDLEKEKSQKMADEITNAFK